MRLLVVIALLLVFPAGVSAQTAAEAQLAMRIQQLEEQIRYLTGENERLTYELSQLRGQAGAAAGQALPQAPQPGLGSPPGDLGSIAANDPLIAPDGDPLLQPANPNAGSPIDLSTLAGGGVLAPVDPMAQGTGLGVDPNSGMGTPIDPGAAGTQVAGLPQAPTSLSGSPRDEYDLAYGYILTGDYELAENSFRNWLAAFPSDPQAGDAQFWLGESLFQQGEYREAANAFLAVYDQGRSTKGPDALLKLGMSLAALGEKSAACATFGEVGRRYPDTSPALTNRVNAEADRAGC